MIKNSQPGIPRPMTTRSKKIVHGPRGLGPNWCRGARRATVSHTATARDTAAYTRIITTSASCVFWGAFLKNIFTQKGTGSHHAKSQPALASRIFPRDVRDVSVLWPADGPLPFANVMQKVRDDGDGKEGHGDPEDYELPEVPVSLPAARFGRDVRVLGPRRRGCVPTHRVISFCGCSLGLSDYARGCRGSRAEQRALKAF